MEPRLIQQQSQKLILSPQIRQYLRLLQLPVTELEQAVEAELAENPLLEESQNDKIEDGTPPAEPASDGSVEAPDEKQKAAEEVRVGETFDHFQEMENTFDGTYDYPDFSRQDVRDLEERKTFQEGLITKAEALSDFLMWQIRFLDLTDAEKAIGAEIIGNIDEDGYLKVTTEELAASCKADPQIIEKVIQQVQDLDPPGIGARNLQEALTIQLNKKGPEAALALRMVSEQLPLVEKRDWQALAKALNEDIENIKKAAAMIARLEPRPGRTFYSDDAIAVTPDATVSFNEDEEESDGNGKFKIDIHDEIIPEVRINPYYRRLLRSKQMDEKGKAYLRDKMQSALNFMKALKLRKSTIREITEEIVKAQPEFLEKGFAHLKPLRLKDIAYNLGIHESTVSRAIHGKYIATPQGMIPYKSFFSTRLETKDGSVESQKSIMEKIKHVVDKEDTGKPLSDQEIVKILQNEGVVIARRTVAKYRELLKILPSHLRRQK
jgi:RNA polymerase sigma-54 factor